MDCNMFSVLFLGPRACFGTLADDIFFAMNDSSLIVLDLLVAFTTISHGSILDQPAAVNIWGIVLLLLILPSRLVPNGCDLIPKI